MHHLISLFVTSQVDTSETKKLDNELGDLVSAMLVMNQSAFTTAAGFHDFSNQRLKSIKRLLEIMNRTPGGVEWCTVS